MAAQAFLVGSETDDPNVRYDGAGPIVAVSAYVLPVFWCGAFATDDMRARRRSGAGASADTGAASYPVLLTSLAEAKKRAVWRRPLVFEYLPASLEHVYDEWLALLDSIDAPYILVDTLDLAGLLDPMEFGQRLSSCVRAFEQDRLDDWDELLGQAGINLESAARDVSFDDDDPIVIARHLRGDPWVRPVP